MRLTQSSVSDKPFFGAYPSGKQAPKHNNKEYLKDRSIQRLLSARNTSDWDNACAAVYKSSHKPVFNFILKKLLGHAADAEDVLNDTFDKAFKAVKANDFDESKIRNGGLGIGFQRWLFSIADHTAIDLIRKIRRHPTVSLNTINEKPDFDSPNDMRELIIDPRNDLEGVDIRESMAVAFDQLTPQQRELLGLAGEGFNYGEMAETQKVPIGTIKSRLHAARGAAGQALREAGLNM